MKWLQWLVDNAWTLIIIGGVLVQMLQAVLKKRGGGGAQPPDERPKEFEFDDPELAERTRRIREEIQRKIAQRAKGYPTEQPGVPEVEPDSPPPIIREVATVSEPVVRASSSRFDTQRQAEILEQQAALMEQLREAERMKAAVTKRTEFEEATADHSAAKRAATRSTVLDDLRSPAALRRAFILREVLGPPVALRK